MKKIIVLMLSAVLVLCACTSGIGGDESAESKKDMSQNSSEESSEDVTPSEDSSSSEIDDSFESVSSIPDEDEQTTQLPRLVIGGIEVNAQNCNDVFGDGTVSVEYSDDYDICFITLNNAKIECDVLPDSPEMESVNGIICDTDIELVLVGENEIYCEYAAPDYIWYRGISYVGDEQASLTVSGEGRLDINFGNEENLSNVYGIEYNTVVIKENITVNIKAIGGYVLGVSANEEDIHISDNGSLTVDVRSLYDDMSK